MSHENDRLSRVFFDFRKEIIAFTLECFIANSKDLIKNQYVALRLDCNRESKTNLHSRRIILQLLVHELFQLSKIDDVIIHCVNFFMRESKKRAVQIYILSASEFRIKSHSQFNEWDQFARNSDKSFFRIINLRDEFKQSGFATTVSTNNTKKFALMDFKANVFKNLLLFIPFNPFSPIDKSLLKTSGLLSRQFKAFRNMFSRQDHRILRIIHLLIASIFGHHITSANLRLFRRNNDTPNQSKTIVKATGNKRIAQLLN